MANYDEKNEKKKSENGGSHSRQNKSIHPGVAAAVGAVVGAAGGAAAAMLYRNPEVQKKAKEQFDLLSKKASDAWNQMNTQSGRTAMPSQTKDKMDEMKEKTNDSFNGKEETKKSSKTL